MRYPDRCPSSSRNNYGPGDRVSRDHKSRLRVRTHESQAKPRRSDPPTKKEDARVEFDYNAAAPSVELLSTRDPLYPQGVGRRVCWARRTEPPSVYYKCNKLVCASERMGPIHSPLEVQQRLTVIVGPEVTDTERAAHGR